MRMSVCSIMAVMLWAALAGPLAAQFKKPPAESESGTKLDTELVQRYRVGIVARAGGGPVMGARGTIPVPTDWPEQQVRVVDEELSDQVRRVSYRTTAGTVKQMVVEIPKLTPGETAKAMVTLEVRRQSILPPEETSRFSIPENIDASLRTYLAPSPYIESAHPRIRALPAEILEDFEGDDWEKIETIYDWVRDNIEYKDGPLKGALQGLIDGEGDCEELSSLFIALCRVIGVPARTVWVPGHCYPEFYMVDEEGNGHWFPCQAAGTRAFGGIPEHRPILQKGDNFRDPDRPRERLRYMSEFFTGKMTGGPPTVRFVREEVSADDQDD